MGVCAARLGGQALPPGAVERLKEEVGFLASDELVGRGPATPGLDAAADFIVGKFMDLRLEPVPGAGDYFQEFEVSTVSGVRPENSLEVGGKTVAGGEHAPFSISPDGAFAGEAVFVGYGISGATDAAGRPYDDYAGLDVKGKVALALRYEPHGPDGRSRLATRDWSVHARLQTKAEAAAKHGAVALLIVHPADHHGSERLALPSGRVSEYAPIPIIQVKQKVAEEMLKAGGRGTLKDVQADIDGHFVARSGLLSGMHVEGMAAINRPAYYRLRNITACWPGRGGERGAVHCGWRALRSRGPAGAGGAGGDDG